ncbi:lysozyme [Burkholderia sp. D-99]|uniref:lysozyme n=1 Tax=Burkholderia sp. D-99 TaxID=2717316 RepID=UPI00141F11FB|nr:lysozyme [Burkholderia sp. D-99]NHV31734.1 lysozyme [Burkholderia sp. D-99]
MPASNSPQLITSRPEVPVTGRQVFYTPQQGQPVDTYHAPSQSGDAELQGLITGLQAFNPALQQYTDFQNQQDAFTAHKAGTTAGELADASLIDAQTGGIKVPPMPNDLKVEPAFNATFAEGYRNSVGLKIANQVQNDILSAYQQNKNTDDFDSERFLHEQVAEHTAGLTDPVIVQQVSKSVAATADQVRKDFAQVQFQRLKETAFGNFSAAADGVIDPYKNLDQMWDGIQETLEPMRSQMGMMTRPEMASMLLDKLNTISGQASGRPELFDLFTQFKDPHTGLTLQQMNPKIEAEVTRARERAVNDQNQRIVQEQQTDFFKRGVADEEAASQGVQPDINDFVNRIGPLNQFKTSTAALSEYRRLQNMADSAKQSVLAVQAVGNGTAWALDKKDAQAALDVAQARDVDVLMQVASGKVSGDASQMPEVQQALKSIVDITGRSGRSDIANSRLKALIDGTVNAVPPKDGQASSQFKLAAALYAGLPDQIRALYFDETASTVFGSYTQQRGAGVDDSEAYHSAYRSISPESQKLAKELTSNPEWKAKVSKEVAGLTTGLLQRMWIVGRFFGGTPQNEEATSAWARLQLRDYYLRNPTASSDQATEWIQQQVRSNFVYDEVNKIDVQVPPNQANELTQEAIRNYIEKARLKHGEDMNPGLIWGRDGKYSLSAFINGAPIHKLADVTFGQIIKETAETKILSQDERSALAALKGKLNEGSATSQDIINNDQVLAKAMNLGQINDATRGQIAKVREDAFNGVLSNVFNLPVSTPSFAGLSGSRLTGLGSKLQVTQAEKFLGSANWTASLIAMGEGLVLKATPDPNPKAGLNIGYGYNLNANAATIGEDFRRAGIPADSLEGIKSGKVQITPEQAARLLELSIPRYEERARVAAESVKPRLWWMINKAQRAALTDVAYQVGDVAQFHRALGALAREDMVGFQDALKVTYLDKDGNRREDTRRNNLRALMINGISAWNQGLLEAYRSVR